MNKKILFLMMIVILIVPISLIAEDMPVPQSEQNIPVDQNKPMEDPWQNPQYVQQHFEENPTKAFESNPEQAWQALENNPNLMSSNPKVLDAAFNQDPMKASAVINNKVELLKDPKVLERYDQEAMKNVALLNDNPNGKKEWFQQKYKITDQGAIVSAYIGNGLTITPDPKLVQEQKEQLDNLNDNVKKLKDEKQRLQDEWVKLKEGSIEEKENQKAMVVMMGRVDELVTEAQKKQKEFEMFKGTKTSFNPNNVKEATVTQKGEIIFKENKFSGTTDLSVSTNSEGIQTINAVGGTVILNKPESNIKMTEGKLVISSGLSQITYQGNFIVMPKDKGDYEVSSICQEQCSEKDKVTRFTTSIGGTGYNINTIKFIGTIIANKAENPITPQFLIKGNTQLEVYHQDKYPSSFNIKSNSLVIYTQQKGDDAEKVCAASPSFSCIIDTPGINRYNSRYRKLIQFQNVQNNDQIDVKTSTYYDKAKIQNLISGEITFSSLRHKKNGETYEISRINVNKEQGMSVIGNAANLNAGRVDYYFEQEGKNYMQHISTKDFQPLPKDNKISTLNNFFDRRGTNVVTCLVDDCEKQFAQTFGKVIPSKNSKTITATIIVAGDHPYLAQSTVNWCKENGCYIVNSRDAPHSTNSQTLIITGHHYADQMSVWRDPPVIEAAGQEGHQPIDQFDYKNFPTGKNVQNVYFSACNTVLSPWETPSNPNAATLEPVLNDNKEKITRDDKSLQYLFNKYPQLQEIVGTQGIAKYQQSLDELIKGPVLLPPDNQKRYITAVKNLNPLGQQELVWTANGKTCYSMKDLKEASCSSSMVVAQK